MKPSRNPQQRERIAATPGKTPTAVARKLRGRSWPELAQLVLVFLLAGCLSFRTPTRTGCGNEYGWLMLTAVEGFSNTGRIMVPAAGTRTAAAGTETTRTRMRTWTVCAATDEDQARHNHISNSNSNSNNEEKAFRHLIHSGTGPWSVNSRQERTTTITTATMATATESLPSNPLRPRLRLRKAFLGGGRCVSPPMMIPLLLPMALVMMMLVSNPAPSAARATDASSPTILLASDGDSDRGPVSLSALRDSLRPATASQPQIPFPTRGNTSTSTSGGSSETTRGRSAPDADATVLRALISVEAPSVSSPRPYNGADVLVLQVWSDLPDPKASATTTTATTQTPAAVPPHLLGGAKIPVGAIVGGFPVSVSLGPQNANANAADGGTGPDTWESTLSSRSVWLRASVCRAGPGGSGAVSPSMTPCPPDVPTPVLEGTGYSKWIELSTPVSTSTSASASPRRDGIRAPTSVRLAVTTVVPRDEGRGSGQP
eukprot:jgi/Psemu1/35880/gm1.35880_g